MRTISPYIFAVIFAAFAQGAEIVKLEGSDATVLEYAIKMFAADQPKADVKNFTIEMTPRKHNVTVWFEPHPERPFQPGYIELGSGNKFGDAVEFTISRRPLRMLRKNKGR